MNTQELPKLKYDAAGLIPAVVQDFATGAVLMVAYMNEESLKMTLESGYTHFWSRSRKKFWKKGETSGCLQQVRSVSADCDSDTLLVQVAQTGPACHTGSYSCFFKPLQGNDEGRAQPEILETIFRVILDRKYRAPEKSYVQQLMAGGREKILEKIKEEAEETAEASRREGEGLIHEVADLWFHTLVLLGWHDRTPSEVYEELAVRRRGNGG